jgi:hypothetical protein
MTRNILIRRKKTLTDYELRKVLEALWHAERNAHPINRREWKRLFVVVETKLNAKGVF